MGLFSAPYGSFTFAVGNSYGSPPEATQYVNEAAIQLLGIPSLYALAMILGHSNPSLAAWKWGKKGMSAFYSRRLEMLFILRLYDPAYWTPGQLRSIDWDTIEHHPKAPPLSIMTERRNAQRQNALSKGRERVPILKSTANTPSPSRQTA